MTELATRLIPLSTGVTLNVRSGGKDGAEPILFLHGFPESHRTWRHQLPDLARDFFVVAPDQRGFAGSDKPVGVENYETGRIVADVMALADALELKHFTLVGHDWGGAVAWATALSHPLRVKRLVVVNAPHPRIFQESLIDDEAQRAASQYIRAFRSPLMEAGIKAMGLGAFFDKTFGSHADLTRITPEERQEYLDEWSQEGVLTSMLNWYRAAKVEVPAMGEEAKKPLWLHAPFPSVRPPTLVIWGLRDEALLPVQLAGLHALVEDLRLVTSASAGHFIPWEEPDTVTSAIRDFMAETA
ncbi:MAG: alpha/beta hydrolase [Alphaproteobacteria bacterium]|nr:alpha/beta hydrolase [Alphaproteobacteria bacterium]MBV9372599.1 alpha/beta hydrolase [Alphaproteobacteria bacterium]MBV9900991.1 alpha/beta hydrolase [Alphaproteobacteria bacterium]